MSWFGKWNTPSLGTIKNLVASASVIFQEDEEEQRNAGTLKESERRDNQTPLPQHLVVYVKNLCEYPDTFAKFPLQEYPAQQKSMLLTEQQEDHAKQILQAASELSAIRFRLVPSKMTDENFWFIYFLLLSNKGIKFEPEDTTRDIPATLTNKLAAPTPAGIENQVDGALEQYLEKLWDSYEKSNDSYSSAMIDDGILPEEDNYFSTPASPSYATPSKAVPPSPGKAALTSQSSLSTPTKAPQSEKSALIRVSPASTLPAPLTPTPESTSPIAAIISSPSGSSLIKNSESRRVDTSLEKPSNATDSNS